MNSARKLLNVIGMILCVFLLTGSAGLHVSANNNITVYTDCNGGTYLTVGHPDQNTFEAEFVVPAGATISAADHTIIGDSPTAIGKDFQGWNVYDASGNMVGSLWNADQVNSYAITETTKFVAQWKDRDPAYTSKDIYFLLWDHNKDAVDYTAKVSVIYGGVKYSGYGFVNISEDIYGTWKGNFDVIIEGNGHYIRENRKWVENSTSTYSLRTFRHMNNISYQMSEIAKGSDTSPVRKSINEFIYSIRNAKPEITVLDTITTEVTPVYVDISESSLPADTIVRAEKYVSGTQLDEVTALIHNGIGGEIKAVYDIEIANASGNAIHDAGANVKVNIDLPADFQISEERQIVVYYVSEDDKLEACTTTLHMKDDGTQYVIFETNHFSVYAIAEVDKPKPTPEPTPDPTPEPAQAPAADATTEPTVSATTEENIGGDEEQEPSHEVSTTGAASEYPMKEVGIGIVVLVVIVLVVSVVVIRKRNRRR